MTPNRSTSIIRFSPGTPVSSTSNTYRHDLTEILLKVPLILNTITLTLTQIVKHQSLWHGIQWFYHCTCIFHINLYDMGYNGSIFVLVFSTSIFMTWGTTVLSLYLYFPHQSLWHGIQWFYHCTCIFHINLYDMGYNGSIFVLVFSTSIFMTWDTMVLSLYLYFPHQTLWHGVQLFYHCTCIFNINLYDMGYNCSIIVLVFST
jgi:hypothetical protein